ncbi:hypothetical protein EVJ58_g1787 [Rhodofomes roseus]|uniref:Major facilitator superfamily (MFS) profile domain-containing protein n=1 Tax=Rhodofomes roseus TaxID=34475 RepID=A0A4Y9YY32_9APHY|nr:hypothetical protein EVJ58_g1787 [Rhodofomes roseus]
MPHTKEKIQDSVEPADEHVVVAGSSVDATSVVAPRRARTHGKATISAYMAIAASAFGLISDGYHNNLMTMTNIVFKKLYPSDYTSNISTRVTNALLVGEIIGQITVGILCDRIGRKAGLVMTTLLITIGAILCTVAHGAHGSAQGLFWFMTIARGSRRRVPCIFDECDDEAVVHQRGAGPFYIIDDPSFIQEPDLTVFIMVTDFPISAGGPLAVTIFLIVLSAAGEDHLNTVWRVCFGIGIVFPLAVFYFRMRMVTSKLYREGAIRHHVPYKLAIKRYWKTLIGTAGTYFLYAFIDYPNGIFSASIISSVIKDGDIKKTAEWQLLLGAIALPVGALLCNPLGRRYTMMLGFGGYVIFGLIIGCGYDRIINIVPLLIVLYGLMVFMSNMGPGNITLLASAEYASTFQ